MSAPTEVPSAAGSVPLARPTGPDGLTDAEVADRVGRGEVNTADERTSRTLGEIARANILTRFNAILGTMLVVILFVGPIQDALFGVVLVANALIGIVQEYRAKRTLDRLAVLNAPRATVVRDGSEREIAVEEVVVDELVVLRTGDQVPADGVVVTADGLEIDESLLTGESDPVDKTSGSGGALGQHRGRRARDSSKRPASAPTRTRDGWQPRHGGSRWCGPS